MRKHLKVSLLLFCAVGAARADGTGDGPNNSHTFLWVRPPFQTAMPEKVSGFWRDAALARDCGISGAFQIVPFGGQTRNAKDLAKYFMFCNKSELVVAEGDAFNGALEPFAPNYNPNLRDVNANNFNIFTQDNDFVSTIQFRPRQSFAGVGLDYKQYMHRRDACEKKWWFQISTPLEWVKNSVNLKETSTRTFDPINGSDLVNTSMVEAFKGLKGQVNAIGGQLVVTGSEWKYGKIKGSHSKFRAADIEVKIGYDYLCEDMCHAEGYIGGLIPTGNKPKGEYVFEPIVGNNFHGGIMYGGYWGWEVWSGCDRYLHFEMATNGRYLFKNTQRRSFDVKGKPWSRYQLVYPSAADTASLAVTNGINFFTRKVQVNPRFQKDINTAFVYTHCRFQGEIGWNFWAKASEHIKLDRPWEVGPAFANINNDGTADNNLNRAITIKEIFTGVAHPYRTAAAIQAEDLDLETAASPCAVTNTIYGSLGWRWDNWCYPVALNVGGSYEISSDKGAVSRYTVWGKFILSL
ncbi:MAG: hypothetical protein AB7R69_00965 [Candidatus Babeliales bacterium]